MDNNLRKLLEERKDLYERLRRLKEEEAKKEKEEENKKKKKSMTFKIFKEKNSKDQKKIKNKKDIEEFNDIIKCFICFNPSKDPVLCRFCGNIGCKNCFSNWINSHHNCGFCHKEISKNDLISPPIIGKIKEFLKEIQNNNQAEQCLKHKEKFLFYCINCSKRYCGKCLYFNSEESKNHIGHKILDNAEIKKSKYNELINQFIIVNETKYGTNDYSKVLDNYMLENKNKFTSSNLALNTIKKNIFNNYKEKNDVISNNIEDLTNIRDDIKDIYNNILDNLKKIEDVEKPIENFNPQKILEKLSNKFQKVNDIETKIENIHNNNNEMKFNNFNFVLHLNKKDILQSTKENKVIELPIYMKFQLEDDTYFSITMNKENEEKKEIYLFPMLELKNKLYRFKRNKNNCILNNMDFQDEDENENNINNDINDDYLNYKLLINIKELDDGENAFSFLVYIFSIY